MSLDDELKQLEIEKIRVEIEKLSTEIRIMPKALFFSVIFGIGGFASGIGGVISGETQATLAKSKVDDAKLELADIEKKKEIVQIQFKTAEEQLKLMTNNLQNSAKQTTSKTTYDNVVRGKIITVK